MTDKLTSGAQSKLEWTTPALVHLEMGLGDVHNGFLTGADGSGGLTTSLS